MTFDLVPRSLEEQVAWIDEHSGSHPAIVALDGDTVTGFASLSPYRPRPAYTPTVEDSVYVHRDHRGAGVGATLLADLVDLARDHGFHSVIGRIVGGHDASISLHRSCGFDEVGIEREVGRKFRQVAKRRAHAEGALTAWFGRSIEGHGTVPDPDRAERLLRCARETTTRPTRNARPDTHAQTRTRRSEAWAGLDSNQRSGNATGLQPVPFGHSGTDPSA